jgi:hypothetical protein
MLKRAIFVILVIAAIAASAAAQDSPAKTQESQPARSAAQSANIRIDLTITDQRTDGLGTPKTMSLVLEDRQSGRLRTGRGNAMLNLDVRPEIVREGRVRILVSLEFTPQDAPDRPTQPPLSASLTALVDDGKSLVMTQSADPTSDRKVRIEVKATIAR